MNIKCIEIQKKFSFIKDLGGDLCPYSEISNGCIAKFCISNVEIQIMKYHRELYLELRANNKKTSWISFYWLMNYLYPGINYHSNFFSNEKNYEASIRKQLKYLASNLEMSINDIILFFNSVDFEYKLTTLENLATKNFNL